MKNPLTPAGIEPATYQFLAQHLNHCATAVPPRILFVFGRNNIFLFVNVRGNMELVLIDITPVNCVREAKSKKSHIAWGRFR